MPNDVLASSRYDVLVADVGCMIYAVIRSDPPKRDYFFPCFKALILQGLKAEIVYKNTSMLTVNFVNAPFALQHSWVV